MSQCLQEEETQKEDERVEYSFQKGVYLELCEKPRQHIGHCSSSDNCDDISDRIRAGKIVCSLTEQSHPFIAK